jgi:N-acetylmuramoyl-L-alanine amidase
LELNSQPFVYNAFPLPHFNEREQPVEMLVFHSMAHNAAEGISRLDELNLSSHYIVDFDGTIWQCVDEKKRAWHAGVSSWQGLTDINSRSIGIEICHNTLGQSAFHRRQIKSLILLSRDIINRWHIAPDKIVAHSDIAPDRKADPGKAFPWQELAAADIGIWYGARFSEETDIIKMLSFIGYPTASEQLIQASAYAFCRRFLPKKTKTMPTRKLLDCPHPKDCSSLLKDAEFLHALQNIYMQYQLYR